MSVTQRDLFLMELLTLAKKDKDVILISPDMGAPALDKWREEVPNQFFATGISEQNSINVAAGFSSRGKKVYVYYMACWSARCFEQIRYSCAIAQNPITILGVGVGLGYAPAGAAHNPTDDMAYMRSICGIEIYSPATNPAVKQLVKYTYKNRKLIYIRLERAYDTALDVFYEKTYDATTETQYNGFDMENNQGVFPLKDEGCRTKICLVTSGYLLSRALKITKTIDCNVFDVFQIKPIPVVLDNYLKHAELVVTLEEQTLNGGGFSSVIADTIADKNLQCKLKRFGLEEGYILGNGTRDEMLDAHGLSIEKITEFLTLYQNQTY